MPGESTPVSLRGIVLPRAGAGPAIDLGARPSRAVLSIIRHRH